MCTPHAFRGSVSLVHPGDVRRSKRLALVLRHRPASVGVELDGQGWTDVGRLLLALGEHGSAMSRDELQRVVETNDKQRFEWDREQDRIRARQGHTVEVDLALVATAPPDTLFHGTPRRNLASILSAGLEPRGRHHVHLSGDAGTAHRVGGRRGDPVVLRVAADVMADEGHDFWRTANGVWLADRVPAEFLTPLT